MKTILLKIINVLTYKDQIMLQIALLVLFIMSAGQDMRRNRKGTSLISLGTIATGGLLFGWEVYTHYNKKNAPDETATYEKMKKDKENKEPALQNNEED